MACRIAHILRRGFTLVEILIVVVILGILAAIVVPQYSSATQDASRVATVDQLQKVRRAIQVYYFRNGNTYPNVTAGDATWGELIDPSQNYLREPPKNLYVRGSNSTVIRIGTEPDASYLATHGWIYNPNTGDVWAAGFDGKDDAYPHP